jgi:glycosyltransferase involved in cell wall biosynthesis
MLISVIIPCYNVEQYIHECIESVIEQTHKNIEIICVDNNSTDNTWKVLIQLKEIYSHLILEKEFKPGACAARNKGLAIAKGEWIQFLDADDLLLKTKIQHQAGLIHDLNHGFIAGAWSRREVNGIEKDIIQFNTDIFMAVFTSQSGNTCSNLWNRKDLINIGGWNETLKSSQEADLMMCLALHNKPFLIDKDPLTIVRERENGQISQLNSSDNILRFIEVRLNYLDELQLKFPAVFLRLKNELYTYLLAFVIKLYGYSPEKALSIYNDQIKHHLELNSKYKKMTIIKLLGLKLFVQLTKSKYS